MSEKIIRDPVHDVIAFRLDRPVDRLLFGLINSAEFQRLRRIRQLGMAHLAYPGADHSRYSHSLGVMETARRILDQLKRSFAIDEAEETLCLAACLLHDLGHGPFSHVFERVTGTHHEELTRQTIADPDGEVNRLLLQHDPALPGLVVGFMRGQGGRPCLRDIFSSQLDADRFDYLLRDNLMTGSRYGGFDLEWLIHALTIDSATDRLAVTYKGISAVEAYLQSRFHMYHNVYFHKVVRSAEGMVKLALQRARRLAQQDRLPWPTRENNVYKALLGQRLTAEEFTDLDDISVMYCFKLWTKAEDTVLAELCSGLLYRRLFKTIDLTDKPAGQAAKILSRAIEIVGVRAGETSYQLFYDEPADTPYQTESAGEIYVCTRERKLVPFAQVSPMIEGLNRQLTFRRMYIHPDCYETVLQTLRAEK